MNGPIDFAEINRAALAAFPACSWRASCPAASAAGFGTRCAQSASLGSAASGSFKVNIRYNNGRWADFATGDKGGDPISLVAYLGSVSARSKRRELLAQMLGIETRRASPWLTAWPNFLAPDAGIEIAATPAVAKPVRNDCEIVTPLPLDAPPLGVKFKRRKPDEIFWFVNEKGQRLFAECRWNLEDGAKEVRPACFTDHGWKLVAYRAPRPIYNLDKLVVSPERPVWLFEGPRKAEQSRAMLVP